MLNGDGGSGSVGEGVSGGDKDGGIVGIRENPYLIN